MTTPGSCRWNGGIGDFLVKPEAAMLQKVGLSFVLALCTAAGASAQMQPPQPDTKVSEMMTRLETYMEKCVGSNVEKFDDRTSSAEVIADGLVFFCWKEGGGAIFEKIAQRSRMGGTFKEERIVVHQTAARHNALPVVLRHRVALLSKSTQ
jgi:hypothetical protein